MKFFNFLNLGFITLMLGLIPTPALAASITIDRFTDVDDDSFQSVVDNLVDSISVENTDGLTTPLNEVIGGTRTITVDKISGGSSPLNDVGFFVNTDDNTASFSSISGKQGSFSLFYDGNGFGSGIDLTDGGINNSFVIDTLSNDQGVTLNFEVSNGINTATLSESLAAGQTGVTYFSFTNFSDPTLLTQATSIRMYSSNEPEDLDFTFRNFESTKVPSVQQVPFEFNPILGIIFYAGLFGIHKIRKVVSQ